MKQSMIVFAIIALAACGLLVGLYPANPVHAQAGMSVASLKGTYGYTEEGAVGGMPMICVGLMVADGLGGVTGSETVQTMGGPMVRNFQGVYTVANDGSGTMTFNYIVPPDADPEAPVPAPIQYKFVILDGKAQIKAIRLDAGVLAKAEFQLQ